MRKSKFLALFLTTIMIISLIQLPVMAAIPEFRDVQCLNSKGTYGSGSTNHRYLYPSYGDELAHFDYSTVNPDEHPVTYAINVNNADTSYKSAVKTSADGIFTATKDFSKFTKQIYIRAICNSNSNEFAYTGNINPIPNTPFIYDFDNEQHVLSDGILYATTNISSTKIFRNAELSSDFDGNKYVVAANEAQPLEFLAHQPPNGNILNSTLLQFDVNLTDASPFSIKVGCSEANTPTIFSWNNATGIAGSDTHVEPGWHNIKIMFDFNYKASSNLNPYRHTKQRYVVFLDDELLTSVTDISGTLSEYKDNYAYRTIRFDGFGGIDNFKYYGSSTPHAYNVGVASTPKSGSVVNGSAESYSFFANTPSDNAPTTYEYTYEVSDTVDSSGSYTKITSTNPADSLYITNEGKLAINGDYTGHFIRTSARACYRGGKSPVVMSKTPVEIQGYETIKVTGGTASQNARFRLAAPFEGELQWSLLTAPDGVTLTQDGLFTVNNTPSGTGVLKVQNPVTGDVRITNLSFISNSETYGEELSEVIEPVIFKADINLTDTTNITAGSKSFTVSSDGIGGVACSDGATFKFIVEDDVYYAFADDKFISSAAFTEDIQEITTDGTSSNYYAGSPLKYDGTFLNCSIVDACESNWIEAPVYEFYNESGVYPESYSYQWYIDGSPASTDARFYIPGGSAGKSIYCEVKGITDNQVVATSNVLTISSQYSLTIPSPGDFTVSLNTEDKDVYLFFVGDDKTVFVADMSDGDPVHAQLPGSVGYNMFFVYKDNLSPRGISTRIPADTTTYSDTLLPEGSTSNLVILTMNSDLAVSSTGAVLFEDPVLYDELSALLPENGQAILGGFIRDAYIASDVTTSYSDFDNQQEGYYNIISINDAGSVTETPVYNELYKLFANTANYDYANFKPVTKKALELTTAEIDALKAQIDQLTAKENILPLMGTNADYFPSAVFLQAIIEQSVTSAATVNSYEAHLEKANLSTDVVKAMEFSLYFNDAKDVVVHSDGIALVNKKLTNSMVLSEVAAGYSTTNIRLGLGFIGSSVFNNASKEAQEFAASAVAKKSYADIPALKTAVENAVSQYSPEDKENNEDSKYDKPSSTISISGGSNSFIPVVPTPTPSAQRFSDAPASHWAYEYIEKMASANVLNGYNGSFRPEDDITRAEFVKVLCAAFKIEAQGDATFEDVSVDSWYAPYVNALASAGIAKGDNGKFKPDEKISRQDAAVLLERVLTSVGITLENGEINFTDANDMSDYAKNAIAALAKAGVINGMEDGSYAPIDNITRAQVAKLICVAIELGGDK